MGVKAVETIMEDSSVSSAIGIKDNKIVSIPFEQAFAMKKQFNEELYSVAQILSK
jgi:6-phosphofructokinase 1